jgi:hypothetical protein
MGDPTPVQGSGAGPRRRRPSSPGSSVLTPPTGVPALDGLIPAQRAAEHQGPSAPPPVVVEPCVCGHGREAHDHHRRGHDCGACGSLGCAAFRAVGGPFRRLMRALGLSD